MSRRYKFLDQEKLYFISYSVVYWIYVFIRSDYRNVLLESWKYCMEHKGLEVWSWVIMPSHVHMIVGTKGKKLEDIIRDMRSFTATKMKVVIQEHPQESRTNWMIWMIERAGKWNGQNKDFQFWQQHNQPIELFSPIVMREKLDYIHENPVKAGFVNHPEHWMYSSAIDYRGGQGLLDGVKLLY